MASACAGARKVFPLKGAATINVPGQGLMTVMFHSSSIEGMLVSGNLRIKCGVAELSHYYADLHHEYTVLSHGYTVLSN